MRPTLAAVLGKTSLPLLFVASAYGQGHYPVMDQTTLIALTANGQPQWIEQGPRSIGPTNSYNEAGAIEAILPDPADANRIFAASVNGGIWRTFNASDHVPQWASYTDHAVSLSIADLAFDPNDTSRNTIFAGIGDYSSTFLGGPLKGLLVSRDAGISWQNLGQKDLTGVLIRNVLPTTASSPGAVILVGASSGVFRSADGGVTFSRLGQAQGLPAGSMDATSLVVDPTNPKTFFAALPDAGIFRSDDSGSSWKDISSGIPHGIGGQIPARLIKLSFSASSPNPLYAAISKDGAPISGIFRTDDHGGTWESYAPPNPALNISDLMFAFAADAKNPNAIYAAGVQGVNDLQRGETGANGQISWATCTGTQGTADNSYQHGDSRRIAFDANGDLLMGDDGGIYRLYNPDDPTQRHWVGMNGSLGVTEVNNNSIGYDTLNKIAFSGHQDTGTAQQATEEGAYWNVVDGGDGTENAVDNSLGDRTTRIYSTGGNLTGSLQRAVYNDVNVQISSQGVKLKGLPNIQKFYGGVVVNRIEPSRIIIFGGMILQDGSETAAIYEGHVFGNGKGDWGDTVVSVPLPDVITRPAGGPGGDPDNVGTMVFGGMSAGAANPDLIYVGVKAPDGSQRLYLRTSTTEGLKRIPYPDAEIVSVAIDPNEWHTAYGLGPAHVYKTVDAGQNWVDITKGIPLTQMRSIEVADLGDGGKTVIVGGANGVYLSGSDGTGLWRPLGANLPNVIVNVVRYYPGAFRSNVNVGELLELGTTGRGVWTWPFHEWRLNLSSGNDFHINTRRGAWGSDGPIVLGDFNGDGKTDVMMWRNSTKSWTVNLSAGNQFNMYEWKGAWGSDGPIVSGDFNGDKKTDVMMWRDSTKSWTVNLSTGNGFTMHEWKGAWGSDGPIVTGDFNGDKKTDVMMWRDSTKSWTVNLSTGNGFTMHEWKGAWGSDGPIVTGDFNGDKKTDVMMWRDSTKSWTVNLSTGNGFTMHEWKGAWGSDGPIVTGDFNGDKKTDVMMWRDSTKSWTVNLSTGNGFTMHEWKGAWGSDGPIVTGDFNGDGKTDVMMWRDSTKTWTVNLSTGNGFAAYEWRGAWGSDGPILVGDFNGDKKTDVMMWRN